MKVFDFSEWLKDCAFSYEEAAHALETPVSLVEYYVVSRPSIPAFRIAKANAILEARRKLMEEKKLTQKKTHSVNKKEILNELLVCLNIDADKNGGGMFWEHNKNIETVTQFQLDMSADIQGFRMKSLKIQTNFDDNKFQPHKKVEIKNAPVFYIVDLFCEYQNQEDFSHFVSMSPTLREKRRKLLEKNIHYVYDYDINNVLRKVFAN